MTELEQRYLRIAYACSIQCGMTALAHGSFRLLEDVGGSDLGLVPVISTAVVLRLVFWLAGCVAFVAGLGCSAALHAHPTVLSLGLAPVALGVAIASNVLSRGHEPALLLAYGAVSVFVGARGLARTPTLDRFGMRAAYLCTRACGIGTLVASPLVALWPLAVGLELVDLVIGLWVLLSGVSAAFWAGLVCSDTLRRRLVVVGLGLAPALALGVGWVAVDLHKEVPLARELLVLASAVHGLGAVAISARGLARERRQE